jgi:hypothetical protein
MVLNVRPFRPQFGDNRLRFSSLQRPSLLNAPDQPFFHGQNGFRECAATFETIWIGAVASAQYSPQVTQPPLCVSPLQQISSDDEWIGNSTDLTNSKTEC